MRCRPGSWRPALCPLARQAMALGVAGRRSVRLGKSRRRSRTTRFLLLLLLLVAKPGSTPIALFPLGCPCQHSQHCCTEDQPDVKTKNVPEILAAQQLRVQRRPAGQGDRPDKVRSIWAVQLFLQDCDGVARVHHLRVLELRVVQSNAQECSAHSLQQ